MFVCMYVHNGFTIKICIVYIPLRHVPLMMPLQWRSRTWRIPVEDYTRTSPDVWRRLTAQQKDER